MVEVCAVFLYWLFVARRIETIDVCIWRMYVFMSVVVTVWGNVSCVAAVVEGSVFLALECWSKVFLFVLFIFWSWLLNRDNGKGVSSFCKVVSTVISRWANMISRLTNFRELRWIFFSLIMGIFLNDDRTCTFDLISMVNVTDCPSSWICISLHTSADLPALTESSPVLVNPVEKDTDYSLSRSLLNGLLSSYLFGKVQLPQQLASCVFGRVFVEWSLFPCVFLHLLVDLSEKWLRVKTQLLWPAQSTF